MLVAHTDLRLGGGRLSSTILLERRFRVHLVERDRVVFDNRFLPPGRRSRSFAHLYATLEGAFETEVAGLVGPSLHVIGEDEFDVVTPDAPRFRSHGAPVRIFELRIRTRELRVPVGLAHGPVPLSAEAWRAIERVVRAPSTTSVRGVLVALATDGVIVPEVAATVVAEESAMVQRLWAPMQARYQAFDTAPSIKGIAEDAGVSVVTAARYLRKIVNTFGLHGSTFRDVMYVMRLRMAAMLLSAPGVTVGEVAAQVGYGSLEAMDRAFANAGLPVPSALQALVGYEAVAAGARPLGGGVTPGR
ncbi:MAG: hypothetical protein R2939_15045 [Kofleriaceae bacterium]